MVEISVNVALQAFCKGANVKLHLLRECLRIVVFVSAKKSDSTAEISCRMYKQVLFFWTIREPAHIAFVTLHLELCLHSHSFHAAHSSWTGREWPLCLGPSPEKMPAPAHADPELLVELGLSRLAVFCA